MLEDPPQPQYRQRRRKGRLSLLDRCHNPWVPPVGAVLPVLPVGAVEPVAPVLPVAEVLPVAPVEPVPPVALPTALMKALSVASVVCLLTPL